jgi:hypothetical protein
MTAIVSMALGKAIKTTKPQMVADVQHTRTSLNASPAPPKQAAAAPADASSSSDAAGAGTVRFDASVDAAQVPKPQASKISSTKAAAPLTSGLPTSPPVLPEYQLFTNQTRAFIYGMQPAAVQNMLDFDFSEYAAREAPRKVDRARDWS